MGGVVGGMSGKRRRGQEYGDCGWRRFKFRIEMFRPSELWTWPKQLRYREIMFE
jgi:hypothetical protein